jgi:hypothetical protein
MTDRPDNLEAALAEAIRRTGVGHYRYLCLGHPDPKVREEYRELVWRIAEAPQQAYPSALEMAGNALSAAARFVASGFPTVDESEYDRRLSLCRQCPQFDPQTSRCRLCGCKTQLKLRMATEHCPADTPKW